MSAIEIVTERLCLRPFGIDDLEAFVAYRSDPNVARYQSWDRAYSMADAESFLASQRGLAFGQPGEGLQLAIVDQFRLYLVQETIDLALDFRRLFSRHNLGSYGKDGGIDRQAVVVRVDASRQANADQGFLAARVPTSSVRVSSTASQGPGGEVDEFYRLF